MEHQCKCNNNFAILCSPMIKSKLLLLIAKVCVLGLCCCVLPLQVKGGGSEMGYQTGNFPLITNIAQLHEAVRQKICAICTYSLRGQVLAATPAGIIFFQDESGFEILETNLKTPDLRVGQLIQLRGTNYVVPTEYGVSLGRRPVADIDGCHPEFESAGSVYLASGQYPIEVLWFTQTNKAALSLYYSSQDFPRKPIPDESLFRFDNERSNHLVSGVQYQCYEGVWQQLPQFEEMVPTKIGVAQNFNLNVRTKTNYVGLVFNGILAVKKDGPYTFYLSRVTGGAYSLITQRHNYKVLN